MKKSTRYALYAAVELARAGEGELVQVARVAEQHGLPASVLAKTFQQLARAGLAVGSRGVGGGYTLARQPSSITVLDVIEALEGPQANPSDHADCPLSRLFDEVHELNRDAFASVTLDNLTRGARLPRLPHNRRPSEMNGSS